MAVPLRKVSGIAAGDLTTALAEEHRADEIGDLLRAFRYMAAKLRETTREIHEGVNVLASSSSEILATRRKWRPARPRPR